MANKKISRILKYKGVQKFQSGGVTFFEAPTEYKPGEDYYLKQAAASRASQAKAAAEKAKLDAKNKKDNKGKKKDLYETTTFIKSELDGFNLFANDTIEEAFAAFNKKIDSEGGAEWALSYEGKAAALKLNRLVTELDSRAINLDKAYNATVSNLTQQDLSSKAYVNGSYMAMQRDKDGNIVGGLTRISPKDYYDEKNADKYYVLTKDELLKTYKKMPDVTEDLFNDLNNTTSGERFLKENIDSIAGKIKATGADGKPLPIETIQEGFTELYNGQGYATSIAKSGIPEAIDALRTNIYSNSSAYQTLNERVWTNKKYRDKINAAENPAVVERQMMDAEIYRLALLGHANPSYKKDERNPNNNDPYAGYETDAKDRVMLAHELYTVDRENTDYTVVTDMATHYNDNVKEAVSAFPSAPVPTLTAKVNAELKAARDSKDKSATLYDMPEVGKWLEFGNIYTAGGVKVETLLDVTPTAFKLNAVIKDPDFMRTMNVPSLPDGTPLQGSGEFMQLYEKKFKAAGSKFSMDGGTAEKKQQRLEAKRKYVLDNMLTDFKGTAQEKALMENMVALLQDTGGVIPSRQKIFTEIIVTGKIADIHARLQEMSGKADATAEVRKLEKSDEANYLSMNKHSKAGNVYINNGGENDFIVIPVFMNVIDEGQAFFTGSINLARTEKTVAAVRKRNEIRVADLLAQLEN